MRPLTFLIWGGVFERHPRLGSRSPSRTTIWVPEALALHGPALLGDALRAKLGDYRSHLTMKPSEYFRRNVFLGASCMPRREAELRHADRRREHHVGHATTRTPRAPGRDTREQMLETFRGLPEAELAAMLGGNAARVYGFDAEKLAPLVARIGPEKSRVPRLAERRKTDGTTSLREDARRR